MGSAAAAIKDRPQSQVFKNTVELANASDMPWETEFGSIVYKFPPRGALEIEAQKDFSRDPFGRPKVQDPKNLARDKDGKVIQPKNKYIIKQGANLEEVVDRLTGEEGSPIFVIIGDEETDTHSEETARLKNLRWQLDRDRRAVEAHRAKAHAATSAGQTAPKMPREVFEADQRLARYSEFGELNIKRYFVKIDGTSFDFKEEAKEHILHPSRWPEKAAGDRWLDDVRDTTPGLPEPKRIAKRKETPVGRVPIARPSKSSLRIVRRHTEPVDELPVDELEEVDEAPQYGPVTQNFIEEGKAVGIEFDPKLLSRVDNGDKSALRKLLEILSDGPNEDELAPKTKRASTPAQLSALEKAREARNAKRKK